MCAGESGCRAWLFLSWLAACWSHCYKCSASGSPHHPVRLGRYRPDLLQYNSSRGVCITYYRVIIELLYGYRSTIDSVLFFFEVEVRDEDEGLVISYKDSGYTVSIQISSEILSLDKGLSAPPRLRQVIMWRLLNSSLCSNSLNSISCVGSTSSLP